MIAIISAYNSYAYVSYVYVSGVHLLTAMISISISKSFQ